MCAFVSELLVGSPTVLESGIFGNLCIGKHTVEALNKQLENTPGIVARGRIPQATTYDGQGSFHSPWLKCFLFSSHALLNVCHSARELKQIRGSGCVVHVKHGGCTVEFFWSQWSCACDRRQNVGNWRG